MTLVMADGRARKTGFPGWNAKDGSPAAHFLSAAPFPCFYRVGCLRVSWKQKPWFLSACKSAESNKILTYLFFFNQTSRLKPPRAKIEGEAIGRECLKSENNYGETAKKYGVNCRQARAAHCIDNGSMEKFRMAFSAPFSERSHL